jgi:hypothetical protein
MNNKSLRTFGLIWSFIFLIIATYPFLNDNPLRYWSLYLSLSFLAISFVYPKLYKISYFYQAWIKFGDFIGKINSKIIIFILFYFLFLPIGILLKIFRKDLLGKKIDSSATSYFIDREKQPEGMENQF